MMGRHHLENSKRPLVGRNDDGGGTGGDCGGVGHNHDSSGGNEVLGNIYRNDASTSCVGISSSVGLTFTSAQWKELERQAMIFKYLTASMPLPHDLLYSLSQNFPAPASDPSTKLSGGEIYNTRWCKNKDSEPGRCKRTDGKKWRCSKDVAPLQKYCDRHLHKVRSRSRKPVEVRNNGESRKKTRLEQSPLPTLQVHSTSSHQFSTQNEPHLFNLMESDRDVSLMMEYESNHWQHSMKRANMGLLANEFSSTCSSNTPIFHQDCVETSNPFSCSNFQAQTGVIDTWSIDNYENSENSNAKSCPVSLHQGNLSPSFNLSKAVASGNVLDGETSKIEVENGLKDSDDCYIVDTRWLPLSRGEPLGEALQPLSVGVDGSNPASPYDSVHTTATIISSPSGVLHRKLFSHSEDSVCNSPARAAPSFEYAFQWFN